MKKDLKIIAFDLETIADTKCIPFLPEIKPKGTLKDPVKIEADIKEKERKQIKDMGMDPLTNLICCAGWYDNSGESGSISIEEETHKAEKKLLIDFWEILSNYDHFITFNGRSFDLRCMLLHGVTHGIRPSIDIDNGKYNRGNHTDLREILAGPGDFAKGKLDFFCHKFLDDHKTEGIDGSKVQSFFDLGLYDDIAKYCVKDAELTYKLYEKCEISGLI